MSTKKSLLMFSMLASVLFSANITFTRGGGGWVGPVIATGAILGTTAAISSSAARDRDYARYREEEAIRRERAAERRHEERMAAMRGSYQQNNPPMDVDYD